MGDQQRTTCIDALSGGTDETERAQVDRVGGIDDRLARRNLRDRRAEQRGDESHRARHVGWFRALGSESEGRLGGAHVPIVPGFDGGAGDDPLPIHRA